MARPTEEGWCPVPTPGPALSGCKPGPRDRELETFTLGACAHQGPLNFSKERITLPRPRQVLSTVPIDQGSDEGADTLTDSHHTHPARAPLQPHLLHLLTLHTPAALMASCPLTPTLSPQGLGPRCPLCPRSPSHTLPD